MTIKRCDRCGTTIENMHDGYELTVKTEDYRIAYDLCNACYEKFINEFMTIESEE